MLALTRRVGEKITIGDDIVITVVSISGGQVRLGISAPRHVLVLREEIYTSMQEENRAAARGVEQVQQLEELQSQLKGRR